MEKLNIEELGRSIDYAADLGYRFISCNEYFNLKDELQQEKFIVLRVDVDYNLGASQLILDLLKKHSIKASFFVRLHAENYNVFSKKHSTMIKKIISEGHEIGYHSELIDMSECFEMEPSQILLEDINIFERFYGIKINGSACHGEPDGKNNLTFWDGKDAKEFNLAYEAYDNSPGFGLFYHSFYISDSDWYTWKNFTNGVKSDTYFNVSEAIKHGYRQIYLLIHPDTFA